MFKEISVVDKLPKMGAKIGKTYLAYFKNRSNLPGESLNPEKARYVLLVYLHLAQNWLSGWAVQIGYDTELITTDDKFKDLVWLDEISPICPNCKEDECINLSLVSNEFTCGTCHHIWNL